LTKCHKKSIIVGYSSVTHLIPLEGTQEEVMFNTFFIAIMVVFFSFQVAFTADQPCPPGKACTSSPMMSIEQISQQPCPPGASCSENYILNDPRKPRTVNNEGLQKLIQESKKRDMDKTRVFSHNSRTSVCSFSSLDSIYERWLAGEHNAIVDRKEYLSPAFAMTNNGKSVECTLVLVVHFYYIETK
jgi:hypothetical protein